MFSESKLSQVLQNLVQGSDTSEFLVRASCYPGVNLTHTFILWRRKKKANGRVESVE